MTRRKRTGSRDESKSHTQPRPVKRKAPNSARTDLPSNAISEAREHDLAEILAHTPPFREGASQIRLLTVTGDSDERQQPLRFSLIVQDLDNSVPFIAISYTWGDETNPQYVFIEDKRCRVRKNCYDALQQTCRRLPVGCEAIWIDSICINQQDPVEKSVQVSLMGDIYAKATHVFACVGPHSDDSEYFVQRALEVANFELCTHEQFLCPACVVPWEQWTFSMGLQDLSRLCTACANFGERRYWNRIWIIQETARARSLSILCGDGILPWKAVHNLEEFLSLEMDEIDSIMDEWKQLPSCDTEAMHDVFKARKDVVQVESVFSLYSKFGCADPRDHLYGLLSLIQWPENTVPISPDYMKTTFDLAVEVQPYLPFEKMPDVLRAFQISSSDEAVKESLQRRIPRSLGEMSPGSTNDSKFIPLGGEEEFCTCAWIWNDEEGNMTAALVKTGESKSGTILDSPSSRSMWPSDDSSQESDSAVKFDQFIDRMDSLVSSVSTVFRPKTLMLGANMVGIICNEAAEGDVLVPFSTEDGQTLLVLRRVRNEDFEIIGQAILLPDYEIGFRRKGWEDDETELGLFTARVEVKIGAEDVVVLFAQDMSGSEDLWDEKNRCERVFTRVTTDDPGEARLSKESRMRAKDVDREEEGAKERMLESFGAFMKTSRRYSEGSLSGCVAGRVQNLL